MVTFKNKGYHLDKDDLENTKYIWPQLVLQ